MTVAQTIPTMAAAAASQFADHLAIADGDTRLTYTELFEQARRFGAGVAETGIQPGDRVAIWAPNSAEWVVALLGLSMAGAVLVPINTRWKGAEAADVLRRSRARLLVTVTDFLGTDYLAMLDGFDLPDLATIVVARGEAPASTEPWNGFVARATSSAHDE